MISKNSTVAVTKEQVSCDLAEEAAILNLKNGVYYGLDSVGARIWDLMRVPKEVTEILDALLSEYDVDSERCERDLLALLQQLAKEGLIEVTVEKDS